MNIYTPTFCSPSESKGEFYEVFNTSTNELPN